MRERVNSALKQAAHRSGGGTDFGTLLSSAQDLVQSSGHVVGPGGRTIVPLQVFTWGPGPSARGGERQDKQRGQSVKARKRKRKRREGLGSKKYWKSHARNSEELRSQFRFNT